MKKAVKNALRAVINTGPGLEFFKALKSQISRANAGVLLSDNPEIVRAHPRFPRAPLGDAIGGFEDLYFLFSCWPGNRGVDPHGPG